MICFAAVDQFLSTNPQLLIRQMSTLKLAHRLTFVAICIWIPHGIPYAIFYEIIPPNGCVMLNADLLRYYSFFYYPVLHGLLPIFVASFSSLLAYRNVRHLVRRQASVVRRRLDRQLTAMIFVRVIVFILMLLPYTIYRIYSLNPTVSEVDPYSSAINLLIYTLTSSLTNLNYAVSFYIFLATSSRYRRQVKQFFVKKCWRSMKNLRKMSPNEIHPLGEISHGAHSDSDR